MIDPPPKIRLTTTTRLVLDLFLATDPDDPLWGYRVTEETGLGPGTVYPFLERLEKAGWITGSWEADVPEGRPRRRLYTLSGTGRQKYAALRRGRTSLWSWSPRRAGR
ncbi:helix-turn-helix transcriptional regulator [Streptosporangium sp. NPDC020072]|uniref:PadR family transcriptional regulator n=1 Tax=Streptosporangium sp. NPDC020072 TaxID=3154788 RepID=UPI00342D3F49